MSVETSRSLLAIAFLAAIAFNPAQGWAATSVKVLLQDTSTDPSLESMKMVAEPATVKAGKVTFTATNLSKGLIHEMIVIRSPNKGTALPYDADKQLVKESGIHSLGEVAERDPGQSGALTLDLKPGSYLLFCNQAGHYKAGMSTTLTVTP